MKKVFALLLAVVMAASMTAPAMASSSEESATCSTMAPYGMCESVGMKQGNQEEVKPSQAKKVARDFVNMISSKNKYDGKFEDWQNAKISKTTILFGIDNDKKYYLFRLSAKGEYAGHVVVSATKDNYPILEFSKGKSPIDAAKENGIDSQKTYRIHAMTYYFKDSGKYYDIHGKKVNFTELKKGLKELREKPKVKKHLAKRAKEAREEWNERLNNNNNDVSSSTTNYGNIKLTSRPGNVDSGSGYVYIEDNTVPLLWHEGCAPTSGAMVLAYWDKSGFSNFPNDYQGQLIEELADAMATDEDTGYTMDWFVQYGIDYVAEDYGYGSDWAVNYENPPLTACIYEFQKGRPMTVYLQDAGSATDRDTDYDWHVIESHGWLNVYGMDYLDVYDTWDKDVHYFAYNDWDVATMTFVDPVP